MLEMVDIVVVFYNFIKLLYIVMFKYKKKFKYTTLVK